MNTNENAEPMLAADKERGTAKRHRAGVELPQWLLPPERQRIEYARKLAAKAGPETVFAVEQLVCTLVQTWEHGHRQADEHRAERDRLEKLVVRLGGGFDRRGLEGEPRGLMVQHGIHTVVEDSQ